MAAKKTAVATWIMIAIALLMPVIGWVAGTKVNAAEIRHNKESITLLREDICRIDGKLDALNEKVEDVAKVVYRLDWFLDKMGVPKKEE